jgi:hypothetical protein
LQEERTERFAGLDLLRGIAAHAAFWSNAAREIAVQIYPAVVIACSWVVARRFDSPVRDGLRRRFLKRPPQTGAQTAP